MQYLKEDVRTKIYNAAIAEFKNFGYQDASIRNIANNAEISLGNIYRYYENKEALYLAVVQPLIDSVSEFVESKYFVMGESLQVIAESVLDFLMEHEDEILIIRKGNTKHYQWFSEFLDNATAKKIEVVMKENLKQFANKIKNPNLSKVIARSFLHCLFDVLNSTVDRNERREYVKEIITFYFGHINTRFGD